MFGIGGKIAAGAVLLAVLAGGVAYWQYKVNQATHEKLVQSEERRKAEAAEFRSAIEAANRATDQLRAAFERTQELNDDLEREKAEIKKEADNVRSEFAGMRSKIKKATLGRPELVGRLATRRTNSVLLDIARATGYGADEREADSEVSPAPAGTGDAAEGEGGGGDAGSGEAVGR